MNISPEFLDYSLYEHANIWQMHFLDTNKLARLVRDLDGDLTSERHLKSLWQIGLLKADYVLSTNELAMEGLSLLGNSLHGQYWYVDNRRSIFPHGLSDALRDVEQLPHGITPYFHPFRYCVLLYLSGVLRPPVNAMQELIYSPGGIQILDRWKQWFGDYTSSQEFYDVLAYHEAVAKLCIATEPCTYQLLFSTVKRSVLISEETQQAQIGTYRDKLVKHYGEVGIEPIEEARRRLCVAAERLDPNKEVHSILRLTNAEMRIKRVKGKLGGAIHLLTMAEMLRRFAEHAFDTKLMEEDELGFGYSPQGVKESFYDSDRILDGNRRSANLFLRHWGLDYGIRLRWYVEGDTELGALEWMFKNNQSVELINLRGQVAERGGKGLTFRENLLNDLKAQIFSLVTIDSDVSNNVRVVRRAAEQDEICGGFYVSVPNFEEMNFTLSELKELIWTIALENGATADQKEHFENVTQPVKSFTELMSAARRAFPLLNQEGKGRAWGARLMEYAWSHQDMTMPSGEAKPRPIIEAVLAALRARSANYLYTRRDYKVDPVSGKSVKRPECG